MSAHSLFYSSTHSSHNYSTRSSPFNLRTPLFTVTDGQRSYQLQFLWNKLPTNTNKINSPKFQTINEINDS